MIAAPNDFSVWIVAVPNLAAIKGAAVTAYDARGKTAFAAVAPFQASSPLQFHLGQVEYLRADDGRMAVLRVITCSVVGLSCSVVANVQRC